MEYPVDSTFIRIYEFYMVKFCSVKVICIQTCMRRPKHIRSIQIRIINLVIAYTYLAIVGKGP